MVVLTSSLGKLQKTTKLLHWILLGNRLWPTSFDKVLSRAPPVALTSCKPKVSLISGMLSFIIDNVTLSTAWLFCETREMHSNHQYSRTHNYYFEYDSVPARRIMWTSQHNEEHIEKVQVYQSDTLMCPSLGNHLPITNLEVHDVIKGSEVTVHSSLIGRDGRQHHSPDSHAGRAKLTTFTLDYDVSTLSLVQCQINTVWGERKHSGWVVLIRNSHNRWSPPWVQPRGWRNTWTRCRSHDIDIITLTFEPSDIGINNIINIW